MQIGNNLGALIAIGSKMRLYPAGLTTTNLVLCNKKLLPMIKEIDVPEELRKLDLPRFGWGYDGTIMRHSTNGANTTAELYHNGRSGHLLFQPTPKFLRGFQDSKLQRLIRTLLSGMSGILASGLSVTPLLIQKVVGTKSGKI